MCGSKRKPIDHETLWGTPEKEPAEEELAQQKAYNEFLDQEAALKALREAGVDLPE